MENKQQTAELNNFKNSPIHDKKAIIEMMDELEPKEMIEVVEFIKSKTKPKDMTQTAVEWLVEEINYHKAWANPEQLEPLIEQAKEMEKEQIENAYRIGSVNELTYGDNKAEQYYKQKYGGNK
jgi:hypothetical protein